MTLIDDPIGRLSLRRGGLLEERAWCGADIDRQHPVRLGLLDVLDRLRELRNAERDEFLSDDLAAEVLHDVPVPFRRDLTEIVVGGDDVDLLAVFLDHPGDQRRELLLGYRPHAEHTGIADAAFILVRIAVGDLVRSMIGRIASREAENASEHHVDLVGLEQAPRKLLITGVVALRIEMRSARSAVRECRPSC